MRKEYISISGVPIVYEYKLKDKKSKPKCPTCDTRLIWLNYRKKGAVKHIGYFCTFCKMPLIYKKYPKIVHINRIRPYTKN